MTPESSVPPIIRIPGRFKDCLILSPTATNLLDDIAVEETDVERTEDRTPGDSPNFGGFPSLSASQISRLERVQRTLHGQELDLEYDLSLLSELRALSWTSVLVIVIVDA